MCEVLACEPDRLRVLNLNLSHPSHPFILRRTNRQICIFWIHYHSEYFAKDLSLSVFFIHHRKGAVGRDLQRLPSPTALLKQVHLEQIGLVHLEQMERI